jgi:hypothetical protein
MESTVVWQAMTLKGQRAGLYSNKPDDSTATQGTSRLYPRAGLRQSHSNVVHAIFNDIEVPETVATHDAEGWTPVERMEGASVKFIVGGVFMLACFWTSVISGLWRKTREHVASTSLQN